MGTPLNFLQQMNWAGLVSFLVNVLHIRKLMRSPCRMELDNGAICPCAQRRFRKLQQIMESLSCNAGPL